MHNARNLSGLLLITNDNCEASGQHDVIRLDQPLLSQPTASQEQVRRRFIERDVL